MWIKVEAVLELFAMKTDMTAKYSFHLDNQYIAQLEIWCVRLSYIAY